MHVYQRATPDPELDQLPSIVTYRFNRAEDVEAWARVDPTLGWKTSPEVWHLDGEGCFRCGFKGSISDSIQHWADEPWPLHRSRAEGLRDGGCAARWLILDSRPTWMPSRPRVSEADAEAFFHLRSDLASIGVNLVDAIVFDDELHWWSLHELTSGSTIWPPLRSVVG